MSDKPNDKLDGAEYRDEQMKQNDITNTARNRSDPEAIESQKAVKRLSEEGRKESEKHQR